MKAYVYIFIIFLLLAIRLFFSVEISDESFYLSEIYSCWLGRKPFMESWAGSGASCFFVPFFHLYYWLFGNLEGIVLFFRFVFWGSQIVLCVCLAYLLRKQVQKPFVWIYSAACCSYVIWSLFIANYNTFFSEIHLLAAVMLYTANPQDGSGKRYFFLGTFLCLGCIAYPTMIFSLIFLGGIIIYINRGNGWRHKLSSYFIGIGIVGIGFLVYIFSTGTITLFKNAIWSILHSQHSSIHWISIREFINHAIYLPIRRYLTVLLLFFVIQCLLYRFTPDNKKKYNYLLLLFFIIFCSVYIDKSYYAIYAIFVSSLFSQIILDYKIILRYWVFHIVILWGISLYLLSSANLNIIFAIAECSGMIMLVTLLSWKDILERMKLPSVWASMLAIVLCGMGVFWSYHRYEWGDISILKMNAKVEQGIYKGIYTDIRRKEFVENVEEILKARIKKEETICVVSCSPYVYTMAQAQVLAPYTWDAQHLGRGFREAWPLINYFNVMNKYPDVLVVVDDHLKDFYQNPKYEINELIAEKYHLLECSNINGINMYIWKKNAL